MNKVITQTEARELLDTTGLEYKITDNRDWYEVETFKDGMLAMRYRSFEPGFTETLQHDCRLEAEKHAAMKELMPFESACYCDVVHMTCSYCRAK